MSDPFTGAMQQLTAVPVTLVGLGFVSAVQTVALEQVYDTKLYAKFLGKGLDGAAGSKFLGNFELRPWISTATGIWLALEFKLGAITYGLGIDPAAVSGSSYTADNILTGLIIGGGTKAVKKVFTKWELLKK